MTRFVQTVGMICGAALFVLAQLYPDTLWWAFWVSFAAVGLPVLWDFENRLRPVSPDAPSVTDCTGGDLCACYACTVAALKPEDRAWLKHHGWNDVIRRPVGPKRSTWQTAFDRELQREAERVRVKVQAAACPVQSGTSRRAVRAKWF